MTITENNTAKIETKSNRKKYGKMQFSEKLVTMPTMSIKGIFKKEQVKEVNLKEDCKFQAQLKEAKAYFSEIEQEASFSKLLRKIKTKVDTITTDLIPILFEINKRQDLNEIKKELIPILKMIGDVRKELSDL